jgi:hypothetical protein
MNGQAVGPTKAFGGDYAIPAVSYTHRGSSLRTALTERRRQSVTDYSNPQVSFRFKSNSERKHTHCRRRAK